MSFRELSLTRRESPPTRSSTRSPTMTKVLTRVKGRAPTRARKSQPPAAVMKSREGDAADDYKDDEAGTSTEIDELS